MQWNVGSISHFPGSEPMQASKRSMPDWGSSNPCQCNWTDELKEKKHHKKWS